MSRDFLLRTATCSAARWDSRAAIPRRRPSTRHRPACRGCPCRCHLRWTQPVPLPYQVSFSPGFLSCDLLVEKSPDQRLGGIHCFFYCCLNRFTQAHEAFVSAERCGLTAHEQDSIQRAIHRTRHAEHIQRMHGVGFDKVCWRGGKFFRIGFYDGDGAGRLPMRKSINEDGGFVAVLQGIGEVETANPEVDNADRLGEGALHQAADNFDTKSVIAEEDVSDSGDEDFLLNGPRDCGRLRGGERGIEEGFEFRRCEEEAVARLAHHSEIASGVVLENDADVPDAFVVFFNAFDGCHLPAQRDVENVSAFFGMKAHAAANLYRGPVDFQLVNRSLVFEEIPFPFIHCIFSFTGERTRKTPCNFMNCSSGMFSVRSRIQRVRSSDCLISRFSASVRVRMRRERISSISVESNRFPALSGAIWG